MWNQLSNNIGIPKPNETDKQVFVAANNNSDKQEYTFKIKWENYH